MKNVIKRISEIGTTCLLGFLSACSSATVDAAMPAVLISSSNANTQIIEQEISQALNGNKVTFIPNREE